MTDKTSVADWSTTADDNDNIAGITLGENKMKPSDVNGAIRTMMAQVAAGIPSASGGISFAADRTALAGIDSSKNSVAWLEESGRQGVFQWDSADLSTEVTADTEQGIYVAPTSDTTGASGAWVRQYTGSAFAAWFGAAGDGTTDDTTAIQGCLDAVPSGSVIDLEGKSFKYSTLTVSQGLTIKNGSLPSATASGVQIDVDPSARFKARGVTFTGGGSHSTFADHKILSQVGTSTARGVGMDLEDCAFSGCGNSPVYSEFCDNHNFVRNRFTDFAYAGFQVLSCNDGNVLWNFSDASNAVGSSNNAYGFTITHHNTGYNTDPNAGTPQATNAFGNNWRVIGNTVYASKIWEGIDFHGGYNNIIAFNRVFGACFCGILCGTSSNDAANYAGYNNQIIGNLVTTYGENGLTLSVDGVYGIVVNGGSGSSSRRVTVADNIVIGYGGRSDVNGTKNVTVPAIRVDNSADMILITGNVVDEWSGCAIEMTSSDGPVLANDNIFGPMRDTQTGSAVVRITNSSARHSVMGNVLKDGGNQPTYGLLITSTAYTGNLTYGSDFRTAGTEVSGTPGTGGSIRKVSYA